MAAKYTSKALFFIIVVLLITNVIILLFFVIKPVKNKSVQQRNSTRSGMFEILKDSVGFSEQQMADFRKLRSQQRSELGRLFSRITSVKEKFYDLAISSGDSVLAARLSDSIGIYQKELDLHMLGYFRKIRALCTPEQLPAYDNKIELITRRMVNPGRGRTLTGKTKVNDQ